MMHRLWKRLRWDLVRRLMTTDEWAGTYIAVSRFRREVSAGHDTRLRYSRAAYSFWHGDEEDDFWEKNQVPVQDTTPVWGKR